MVKSVFGTLDTTDILFSFNSDSGLWEVAVPKHEEGTYIVELYAEDYAGNVAYMATVLFTFDVNGICIGIEVSKYNAEFKLRDIKSMFGMRDVLVGFKSTECDCMPIMSDVNLNIVRCEVCGRW
jgi:hypothetical protein